MVLTPIRIPGKRKRDNTKAAVTARKTLVSSVTFHVRISTDPCLEPAARKAAQALAKQCGIWSFLGSFSGYKPEKEEGLEKSQIKTQDVGFREASDRASWESVFVLYEYRPSKVKSYYWSKVKQPDDLWQNFDSCLRTNMGEVAW